MTRSVYAGRRIALLTQHGKEAVIAPVLDTALGCRVERVSGFDTDTLGTFTRDIPRAVSQREAARRKARIGMELSGLPLGLASEGSFGPDPMAGLFPWNVEVLLFIDDERDIEVTGMAQQATRFAHLLTDDWEAAAQFARQAGLPEHHLVVRPHGEDDLQIEKGLDAWTALEDAFHRAREQAANGQVFLENDVRAHAHPTRREAIRLAAEDLAAKLDSLCPVRRTRLLDYRTAGRSALRRLRRPDARLPRLLVRLPQVWAPRNARTNRCGACRSRAL